MLNNGRKVNEGRIFTTNDEIHGVLRILGGKGGFGSMLRAIGAQIEKTTNREACRDLSGRRLRDINEEKRMKNWIEKQQNAEQVDPDEKFNKKIGKLMSKPKHVFKDEKYETARSDLTQNIDDAVEQGFKKAKEISQQEALGTLGLKRKASDDKNLKNKKKTKGALWLGDDLSSSSETDSDEDSTEASTSSAGAYTSSKARTSTSSSASTSPKQNA